MKNDFTEEELKQINRELAELRKHIQEKKKRYIIGPDGEPLLDPAGIPILKKQTINFKTQCSRRYCPQVHAVSSPSSPPNACLHRRRIRSASTRLR